MFADFPRHFYRHWLKAERAPDWLTSAIPKAEATDPFDCGKCFMTKPAGLTRDLGPFEPELKCCTYHPFLPNFTLGALAVEVNEGRLSSETFDHYLKASRLTVLGAFSGRSATSVCETGKNRSEKCPFLKGGQCSVHGFRPSTCSTYVCRSNAGEAGLKSWRTFERQLAKFEWSLAHEAAFEIGFTKDELETVYSSTDDAKAVYARALKAAQLTSVRDWDE
jgi:Fe-S-cluster containining protein